MTRTLFRLYSVLLAILVLNGCSMNQMVVRSSMGLMEDSIQAMNRETDLELARAAIPANLKMLEGMIESDPANTRLRLYAAEGYYGYTFAFVERPAPERASALYQRCRDYAADGLALQGFKVDLLGTPVPELSKALQEAGDRHVPALFWTASCWAKWIDLNRDDPRSISQLSRTAVLMQRVLELNPEFYHGGPHVFFGIYHGSRPAMLGGDPEKAAEHFEAARRISGGRLLMVDVLQAEFLDRQQLDRDAFHNRLVEVVRTPASRHPELAFANQVARQRAQWLLSQESQWF